MVRAFTKKYLERAFEHSLQSVVTVISITHLVAGRIVVYVSRAATLHHQCYTMHYDMCKRKEFHLSNYECKRSRRHLEARLWVRRSNAWSDPLLTHVLQLVGHIRDRA